MDWLLIIGGGAAVIGGEVLAIAIAIWIFDVNLPAADAATHPATTPSKDETRAA